MCKSRTYQISRNLYVERSLKEKRVKCENQKDGCRWVEMLEKYDTHLNASSTDFVERMEGCKYTTLQCRFGCGETRPRHSIAHHEIKECSQQLNDCTEKEKLLQLRIQQLLCEAVALDKQLSQKNEQLAKKDEQMAQKDKLIAQKDKLLAQKDEQLAEKEEQLAEFSVLPIPSELKNEQSQPVVPDPLESADIVPVVRVLHNFKEKKNYNRDYKSRPFFTHEGGYKMCLWIFPNGYRRADSTHVSLFLCFMKGEHDEKLKWPFRGKITVHLLNQLRDSDHKKNVITYDCSNSRYAEQVKDGEMSRGYGASDFISLKSLIQKPYLQFLKDDCLKIRVTEVQQVE